VSYERDGDIDQLLKDASAVITETDEDGSEITVMNTAISKAWSALAMAKSEDVREYILELLMDQRQRGVVVFFYHIALGRYLQNALEEHGFNVGYIDGSVKNDQRDYIAHCFNDPEAQEQVDVIIGQVTSMGVSLNLQRGGRYCVFAERPWSWADYEQAYKRVYRMGQDRHVQVDNLITDTVIEEMQTDILNRKRTAGKETIDG
jgi:SNF2 family DNA or RNA helicase